MKEPDDDKAIGLMVGCFVSVACFLLLFVAVYYSHGNAGLIKHNNSVLISGYLCYYTYGYVDDEFIFEVCVSSESGYKGEKTIYKINPSQKDSFLRYNTVGSQVSFYASTKSVYEIRSLKDDKEEQYQYNGTQEQ
jgi:hypothetical protein